MSKLVQLIEELCPTGVPFTELRDVCQIKNGKDWKTQEYGDIPVYGSGGRMDATVLTPSYDKPTVLLPRKGSLNVQYVEEPFWNVDTVFYTICDEKTVDPKFLFYYLKTINLAAISTSSTRPSLTQSALSKIRVPLAPLPVQQEIVRVLDMFTQLEAELEAELEARSQQYGHYLRQLMTFEDNVDMVRLGELVEVRSGWGFPSSDQGSAEGDLPFYKVSDMNLLGNETVMSVSNNYVTASVARRLGVKVAPAGAVIFPKIGAAIATNKKRLLSVPSAYDNNVMGLVPGPRIISKYLYYWIQTYDLSRLANDSGAVPSIRKSEAERLLVPLPNLDEQHRLASLLDKFDVLVNDIKSGIPAEIMARRRQYEYYRDKLLSFEELSS